MWPLAIYVLCRGAEAKITFAIVQSIVVFVVAVQMLWGVHYHSVYENRVSFFRSTSIKDLFCFTGTPFILAKPPIIFGVDLCELALCQWYQAEISIPVFINNLLRILLCNCSIHFLHCDSCNFYNNLLAQQ